MSHQRVPHSHSDETIDCVQWCLLRSPSDWVADWRHWHTDRARQHISHFHFHIIKNKLMKMRVHKQTQFLFIPAERARKEHPKRISIRPFFFGGVWHKEKHTDFHGKYMWSGQFILIGPHSFASSPVRSMKYNGIHKFLLNIFYISKNDFEFRHLIGGKWDYKIGWENWSKLFVDSKFLLVFSWKQRGKNEHELVRQEIWNEHAALCLSIIYHDCWRCCDCAGANLRSRQTYRFRPC